MNPQWSNQQQQQQYGHNLGAPMNPAINRLTPQQTGWQQPMMTGYGGGGGMGYQQQQAPMQRPMQTGYMGSGVYGGAPPPVPPMPMMPQATGYPGGNQPMLGSFSAMPSTFVSTFMPSNPNAGWNSAAPMGYNTNTNLQSSQPASLPQYFQQHNQQQMGRSTVQVQWALTADERRNYDKIFRAWDNGSGFITGAKAQEVFRESGLDRDDLMKIWALSDRENRGKLNLAEFHVAMGLIYRKLSGNQIPDVLPAELVPPSSRDLDQSVDFLKDLLRNDTNARSTNLDPTSDFGRPGPANKYSKLRSFNSSASPDPTTSKHKDATVYKHDDSEVKTYKPSSRHLDRRNVRFQGEDESSELADLKRQLKDSQDLLEKSHKVEEEDEDLKQELDDLKYRIRRVKDDIEYNKSGRRTEAKDEERRRLERQLLFLMHEKLPELEDKMRNRERIKRSEDRAAARKRDARNNNRRYDSYDDRDEDSDRDHKEDPRHRIKDNYGRTRDEDDSEEDEQQRGYLRGSYGRNQRYDRDERSARRPTSRERIQDEPAARSPSPPPRQAPKPPAVKPAESPKAPPPAIPSVSSSATVSPRPTSPAIKKPQTAEERQAFIRAEAQRRVQERMRLLTGQSPTVPAEPAATAIDTSVNERLEQERKEAAERSAAEDKAADEREKSRQLRLEEERLKRIKREEKSVETRGSAIKQVSNEITASEVQNSSGNPDASQAARAEIEAEERANKQREEAVAEEKRKAEERVKQLEAELEASRQQAKNFETNKALFASKSTKGPAPPVPGPRSARGAPPKPPTPRNAAPPTPTKAFSPLANSAPLPTATPPYRQASQPASAPTPPVAPPAPTGNTPVSPAQSPIAAPVPTKPNTNPFLRLGANGASAQSPQSTGLSAAKGSNPFFRPPTGAETAPQPTVNGSGARATPPPSKQADDDWDDIKDLDKDSDDSDDEGAESIKNKRANLAGLLFGGAPGSAPTSRPSSTRPEATGTSASPAPPKAPAAPLPPLGAAAGSPPPRSALLGAIQGGAKLRKTVTSDRSQAQGAGAVIGDASAPVQTYVPPPAPSSPEVSALQTVQADDSFTTDANTTKTSNNLNRQSVDWYGGLAADTYPSPTVPSLPPMQEEAEEQSDDNSNEKEESAAVAAVPASEDPEDIFDFSIATRVRSLYNYEARGEQDASFGENVLIVAHPPKDPAGDWLYGMVASTGSKGWLPKTYVEELPLNIPCTALYDYEGDGEETMSMQSGAKMVIGDKLGSDWARVVVGGKVGLVPLTYLEES